MQQTPNQDTFTDTFTMPEGLAAFRWPSNIGPDSFQDLRDWMNLQLRKIERAVIKSAKMGDNPDPKK